MQLKLNHISVLVSNLDLSIAFYHDLLGLPLIPRPNLGFEGAWFGLGSGIDLHLLALPNPDPVNNRPEHSGRDRHIALQVNDLELAKNLLMTHNVTFTLSKSGRSSIFFRDPDGNGIELMQLT